MADGAKIKEAIESSETSAVVLNAILTSKYGEDVYDWDPLTVYLELKADFRADPSAEVIDRIGALQVIMTTDAFFKRLDAFVSICNTLSSGEPYFAAFDPATTEEMAWGISEVALLREQLPYNPAIKDYITQVLAADGYSISNYPEPIKLVFEPGLHSEDIKQVITSGSENKQEVEQYVDEQLLDVISQFNRIPSLNGYEQHIFKKEMANEAE